MRNALTAIFLFGLSLAGLALFNADPELLPPDKTVYIETRLKESDEVIEIALNRTSKRTFDEKDYIINQADSDNHRTITYYVLSGETIKTHSFFSQNSAEGKTVNSSTIEFDWNNLLAYVEWQDFVKSEKKTKTVKLTKNTIIVDELRIFAQNLLRQKQKESTARLLLPNGETINMKVKVQEEIKEVKVNNQPIKYFRVTMKPDLGLISLIIPEVDYWFAAEPPYNFVRYSGLQSGPGSPDVIIEAVPVKN
ncbi:MAG: hypothetical protein ABIE84_07045 [bacterium]